MPNKYTNVNLYRDLGLKKKAIQLQRFCAGPSFAECSQDDLARDGSMHIMPPPGAQLVPHKVVERSKDLCILNFNLFEFMLLSI